MAATPPRTSASLLTLLGVVAFALAWPAPDAGARVFRCVDAGHVTYSDRDCGSESVIVAIAAPETGSRSYAPSSLLGERSMEEASFNGVTLGMSPQVVLQMLGRPRETVATLQGRSLIEYWFYRNAGGRTSIAFEQGRVSGIRTN